MELRPHYSGNHGHDGDGSIGRKGIEPKKEMWRRKQEESSTKSIFHLPAPSSLYTGSAGSSEDCISHHQAERSCLSYRISKHADRSCRWYCAILRQSSALHSHRHLNCSCGTTAKHGSVQLWALLHRGSRSARRSASFLSFIFFEVIVHTGMLERLCLLY